MRKPALLLLVLIPATLWALFQRPSSTDQVQKQWLHVLELKRNWSEAVQRKDPSALSRKQMWADALAQFTAAYPDHERAARAHEDATIEYAGELYGKGRYAEAADLYRAVLAHNSTRADARAALELALTRLSVSRPAFDKIKKGMTADEVRGLIGAPPEHWTRTMKSGGEPVEAWFYRRSGSGVAGVYFSRGKVFKTEFQSPDAPPASPETGTALPNL